MFVSCFSEHVLLHHSCCPTFRMYPISVNANYMQTAIIWGLLAESLVQSSSISFRLSIKWTCAEAYRLRADIWMSNESISTRDTWSTSRQDFSLDWRRDELTFTLRFWPGIMDVIARRVCMHVGYTCLHEAVWYDRDRSERYGQMSLQARLIIICVACSRPTIGMCHSKSKQCTTRTVQLLQSFV